MATRHLSGPRAKIIGWVARSSVAALCLVAIADVAKADDTVVVDAQHLRLVLENFSAYLDEFPTPPIVVILPNAPNPRIDSTAIGLLSENVLPQPGAAQAVQRVLSLSSSDVACINTRKAILLNILPAQGLVDFQEIRRAVCD